MADQEREIRLQIMIQPQELEAIEAWRFAAHMPSRASAVRELLRRGLMAEGFKFAPVGKSSRDFSISDKIEKKDTAE